MSSRYCKILAKDDSRHIVKEDGNALKRLNNKLINVHSGKRICVTFFKILSPKNSQELLHLNR